MLEDWYRKNYMKLLFIPLIVFIISIVIIGAHYNTHGDFINKDVNLAGGTSITIETKQVINLEELELLLNTKLEQVSVRLLTNPTTKTQQGLIVDTSETDTDKILLILSEFILFETKDVSMESTGSSLGESFYKDLVLTLGIAFILMAIAVFISFRTAVPSLAVILAAIMDIVITVAVLDVFGFRIAAGGIVALLLVIGYSIDTDVLLTTKMLKQGEGSSFERIKAAAKTGLTMTITTLIALTVAFFVSFNPLLRQMFLIIIIALIIDIFVTYGTNAAILYRYVEKKR